MISVFVISVVVSVPSPIIIFAMVPMMIPIGMAINIGGRVIGIIGIDGHWWRRGWRWIDFKNRERDAKRNSNRYIAGQTALR